MRSAISAVSPPVLLLGLLGGVVAWQTRETIAARAAATSLLLYAALTMALAARPHETAVVEQLEATRLMPFQRMLTIYLAAFALARLPRWLGIAPRR